NEEPRPHKTVVDEILECFPAVDCRDKEPGPEFIEVARLLSDRRLQPLVNDLPQLYAVSPVNPDYGRLSLVGGARHHQLEDVVAQEHNKQQVAAIHSQVT